MIADEVRIPRREPASKPHWWDTASDAFDQWLAGQDDEIRDLTLTEQIDIYAADQQAWAS